MKRRLLIWAAIFVLGFLFGRFVTPTRVDYYRPGSTATPTVTPRPAPVVTI
jgi:hypothetical protein